MDSNSYLGLYKFVLQIQFVPRFVSIIKTVISRILWQSNNMFRVNCEMTDKCLYVYGNTKRS